MNQNERIRRQRDTANEELHALEHGMKYFHNHLTGEEQVVRRTDDLIKVETCRFYFKDLQAKLAAAESKLKAVDAFIKLLKEDHAKQLAAAETKIKELEELCEKGNIARGQLAWRAARMESDEKLIRELRREIEALKAIQQPAERITPPYEILGIYVTLVDGKVQAVSWNPDRQTQERSTTLKDEDF